MTLPVPLVTIPLLTCWPQRVISLCQETNAIFCENRLPPRDYFLKQSVLMTSSFKFLICHLNSTVWVNFLKWLYFLEVFFWPGQEQVISIGPRRFFDARVMGKWFLTLKRLIFDPEMKFGKILALFWVMLQINISILPTFAFLTQILP